jgi:hypothetical protein
MAVELECAAHWRRDITELAATTARHRASTRQLRFYSTEFTSFFVAAIFAILLPNYCTINAQLMSILCTIISSF